MVAFIQKAHGCIFLYNAIEAQAAQLAIFDSLHSAFCVLRSAFCVLHSAFCVLRSAFRSVLQEQRWNNQG